MENNSEKDTLPNLQTVLDAVNNLRSEMNTRFDKVEEPLTSVEQRLSNVETRLSNVETDLAQVKEMQFVFENEFDRIKAAINHSLSLSYENRPEIRIMRKEISAWSRDVQSLERRVA